MDVICDVNPVFWRDTVKLSVAAASSFWQCPTTPYSMPIQADHLIQIINKYVVDHLVENHSSKIQNILNFTAQSPESHSFFQ